MTVVVDASVAVKWVADEEGSAQARELYLDEECIAPSLIFAEIGSAMCKKQRLKLVTERQALAAIEAMPERLQTFELPELTHRAVELAIRLNHPIYDCFYLALAERERLTLVSADDKLIALAKKMRIAAKKLEQIVGR